MTRIASRLSSRTPTHTPSPTTTPSATAPPTLLSTPVDQYAGVPIPREALNGEYIDPFYLFSTAQSPEDVAQFYIDMLPLYGWRLQEYHVLYDAQGYPSYVNFHIGRSSTVGTIDIERTPDSDLTYVEINVAIVD